MISPYYFTWGASIYAKVIATNKYGDSLESDIGNGAILMTNPDTPRFVQENTNLRSPTSISISWSQGLNNGGDTILDYRISMAESSNSFDVIA
jgi:hypothetical protein